MPQFKANIDETRYYPTLGITVNPGDVVDVPEGVVVSKFDEVKASKKNAVDSADNKE